MIWKLDTERKWITWWKIVCHASLMEHIVLIGSTSKKSFLMITIVVIPYYVDIVNYLVSRYVPQEFNSQLKKRIYHLSKDYFWDESVMYKKCVGKLLRKCVHAKSFYLAMICHTKNTLEVLELLLRYCNLVIQAFII